MEPLSHELQQALDDRVMAGAYRSAEDFLRDALEAWDEREEIETILLTALNGGGMIELTPEFWEAPKRGLRDRFGKR